MFVDHAEMEWSAHCNGPEHRWTVLHHGVMLTGPPPDDFAEVPSDFPTRAVRSQVPGFMAERPTLTGHPYPPAHHEVLSRLPWPHARSGSKKRAWRTSKPSNPRPLATGAHALLGMT